MNSKTDPKVSGLEEQYRAGRISRREFIRQAVFLGVSLSGISAFLASCAAPPPTPVPASAASPTSGVRPTIAPTATAAPTGPYGELKVAVASFGQGIFDPVTASGTTYDSILTPIFEFVIRVDANGKSTGIAEKWEMASDGLSWTFHIRKGVKFHNGDDLTAKDVKFSLDSYAGKDSYFPYVRDTMERAEVVDDFTLRVYTKGVQPRFTHYIDFDPGLVGVVIPKDYIEKNGLEYFKQKPVGTGPFRFAKSVAGDSVQYEAVEKHWRQTPAFKTLTTIRVPEAATRIAMIKTGEVDAIESGVESAPQLEAAGLRTAAMAGTSAAIQLYGAYDPRAKSLPVGDVRVRQALSLAVNRDELGRTFFNGKLQPPMPLFMFQNPTEVDAPYWKAQGAKAYRYDPQAATQLLKEAGYPQAFNNSTIKMFAFYTGGGEYLPSLAQAIQGYWQKIGVKCEVVAIEEAAHRALRRSGPDKGPADQLVGQATMFAASTAGADMIRSMLNYFTDAGAIALLGKGEPELQKLVQDAATERNDAKRFDMVAKAIQQAIDTYLWITIGTVPIMGGLGSRVDLDFPTGANSIPKYAEYAKHAK